MLVVNKERGNGFTGDQGGVYGMLLREERMTKKLCSNHNLQKKQ